jgi:predicted phage tail protein
VNGPILITGTSYTATGLTNGTTYYFTVAAVNSVGSSGPSNEAAATPAFTPRRLSTLVRQLVTIN